MLMTLMAPILLVALVLNFALLGLKILKFFLLTKLGLVLTLSAFGYFCLHYSALTSG